MDAMKNSSVLLKQLCTTCGKSFDARIMHWVLALSLRAPPFSGVASGVVSAEARGLKGGICLTVEESFF